MSCDLGLMIIQDKQSPSVFIFFAVCQGLALLDHCDFGYPDGPEMNDCKLQLQQFVNEWELMQCPPSVAVSELEIGDKSPEVLLQEMIHQMESECKEVVSILPSIQINYSHIS